VRAGAPGCQRLQPDRLAIQAAIFSVFRSGAAQSAWIVLLAIQSVNAQMTRNHCIPGSTGRTSRFCVCFPKAKLLQAKGLCLRDHRCRLLGRFSEGPLTASITVDMGISGVLAMFREIPGIAPAK
jgi:hypothetical protein